jgi:hypothetical protein
VNRRRYQMVRCRLIWYLHRMFIRLRHRRNLKGVATASASYDVVETVRVDGKPRHKFVLGLGSLKQPSTEHVVRWFWINAVNRMLHSNLSNQQCLDLMRDLASKAVPAPTAEQCEEFAKGWPYMSVPAMRLRAFVAGTKPPYRRLQTEE